MRWHTHYEFSENIKNRENEVKKGEHKTSYIKYLFYYYY